MNDECTHFKRLGIIVFALLLLVFICAAKADNLIGKWRMGDEEDFLDLELSANGRGVMGGESFSYRVQGDKIIVTYEVGDTETLTYRLTGNVLNLHTEEGVILSFQRLGGAPPSPPGISSPKPPETKPPSPRPPSRQMPAQPPPSSQPSSPQFTAPQPPSAKSPAPTGAPRQLPMETYTLKRYSSVKIGYPRGWTVDEQEMGISITEKPSADTAGILIILGALQEGMTTNKDFAGRLIDALRQSSYPDFKVTGQRPHPQASAVLTMDAVFTSSGVPHQSHIWCLVDKQKGIGLFTSFYAPVRRYQSFDVQGLLGGCLAPMLGTDKPAASPAAAAVSSPTDTKTRSSDVSFLLAEGGSQIAWCSINPRTGAVNTHQKFHGTNVTGPARWRNGDILIFAVKHPTHPKLIGTVRGKAFELNLPANKEISVRHPTISRDGRLLAFSIKSSKHVGNIDVYDASSGAYDHTFMGVGTWFKIISVDIANGKQQAIYYDDPLVANVMKKRGLGPVFSPTQDILVYADNQQLHVCDSMSGRNLRDLPTPQVSTGGWTGRAYVSEYSGMAFSPDGSMVAYLSQGEADIAVSPHLLVILDVNSGASRFFVLPQGLSGWTPWDIIYLDFSPDGRYVVFSGSPDQNAAGGGSGVAGPFLYVLDTQNGDCFQLKTPGKSSDPVWKGR